MPRCNTRHHNNNNPMQHPFHLTKVTTLHVTRLLACSVYIAGEYIFVTRAHPISSPFKALLSPIHALLHSNYHTIIIMCDVHSPTHNPPHIHIYNAQTQWNATRRSICVYNYESVFVDIVLFLVPLTVFIRAAGTATEWRRRPKNTQTTQFHHKAQSAY